MIVFYNKRLHFRSFNYKVLCFFLRVENYDYQNSHRLSCNKQCRQENLMCTYSLALFSHSEKYGGGGGLLLPTETKAAFVAIRVYENSGFSRVR